MVFVYCDNGFRAVDRYGCCTMQIPGDPDLGGEGVRPQDHPGVPSVRVRVRYPAGAGEKLCLRRERLEFRQEQQKVRGGEKEESVPNVCCRRCCDCCCCCSCIGNCLGPLLLSCYDACFVVLNTNKHTQCFLFLCEPALPYDLIRETTKRNRLERQKRKNRTAAELLVFTSLVLSIHIFGLFHF